MTDISDTIAQIEALLKDEDRMYELSSTYINPVTGSRSGIAVATNANAREWQTLDGDRDERRTVAIESLPKLLAYIRALEKVRDAAMKFAVCDWSNSDAATMLDATKLTLAISVALEAVE
jgi:hypothetical protein